MCAFNCNKICVIQTNIYVGFSIEGCRWKSNFQLFGIFYEKYYIVSTCEIVKIKLSLVTVRTFPNW